MSQRRRISPWWLLAGLVFMGTIWFAWHLRGAPRVPASVGPDTTRLTEPLAEDGFPDYVGIVDRARRAGLAHEDNALHLLATDLGVPALCVHHEGRIQLGRAFDLHWDHQGELEFAPPDTSTPEVLGEMVPEEARRSESDHVRRAVLRRGAVSDPAAAWGRAQANVAEVVARAASRKGLWFPAAVDAGRSEGHCLLPPSALDPLRQLSAALALRAHARIAAEEIEGAASDLVALWRLAGMTHRIAGSESWIGAAEVAQMALRIQERLLGSPRSDEGLRARLGATLEALSTPSSIAESAREDRWFLLDLVLRITGARAFDQPRATAAALRSGYDGNLALQEVNRLLDDALAFVAAEDYAARARLNDHLEKLGKKIEEESARYRTATGYLASLFDSAEERRAVMSRGVPRWLALVIIRGLCEAQEAHAAYVARVRLGRLALRVAAHRARTGAWPQEIASLGDAAAIEDPFCGRPFTLRVSQGGLVISSVGPDLAGDDGRDGSDDPSLVLR